MRRPVFPLVAAWFTLATAFCQLPTYDPPRKWTVTGGTTFDASVVAFDGTNVVFHMANGARAQAPVANLSADDAAYLAAWQKKQPIKVVLPDVVGVETAQLKTEVVSEDSAAEKFVYRTQHFEFESQGKFTQSLLREVGRSFEATYELVKAMPWGIDPKPESGEYFHARLLKDKASYHAAGGPQNSGGVYIGSQKLFLVPFENIGVKLVGKSYTKTEDFETHTMVHELTHQMMHATLRSLPQWVVEGTAEYTGIMPLKTGHFRVSAAKMGLKDYVDFLKNRIVGGVPEPYPLEPLFGISNEKWNSTLAENPQMSFRLYFTSYLLVYYFMHLDGKGDAQNIARYFREIKDGKDSTKGESRDAFQTRTLAILLDGRTESELMKQIRSAYTRLGIRL